MKKEKFISYISKYLLAMKLVMILGLINEDRGLKGFPFAWLGPGGSGYIDIPRFIISSIVILVTVIAADLIAKAIIRVREPSIITLTKEASIYPLTDVSPARESSVEIAEDQIPEFDEAASAALDAEGSPANYENIIEKEDDGLSMIEDNPEPRLKKMLEKNSSDSAKSANQGWGIAIAILVGIFSILVPILADFNDDYSYDDEAFYFVTNEAKYYGTEKEEYIDYTKMALEELFDNMVNENNPLGEFTNEEETEDLLYLCVWENMQVDLLEIYIDEEKGTSVSRFVINDEYGNEYLAAVLMDIEMVELEDWEEEDDEVYIECDTEIKGMAVLPENGEGFVSEITMPGSEALTDDDIKDSVNLGQTTYESVNILLWKGDKGNLHLEAEDKEAA